MCSAVAWLGFQLHQGAPPDFSFRIRDGKLTRLHFGRKGTQCAGSLDVGFCFIGDDGACDETFNVLPNDCEYRVPMYSTDGAWNMTGSGCKSVVTPMLLPGAFRPRCTRFQRTAVSYVRRARSGR